MPTLLPLLWLAACNPPLRGGLYLIEVTDVAEDSCGIGEKAASYEDDGSVWWEDRETMVLATTSGEWWWHWDGDLLTRSAETVEAWAEDCEATWLEDFEGTIDDPNHWRFDEFLSLDLAGACSGYDTSMLPCTLDVAYVAERIGD